MKNWAVFTTIILCSMAVIGYSKDLTISDNSLLSSSQRTMYFFDKDWRPVIAPTQDGYYRKIITINNMGITVQDFYQNSNQKQSNPFTFNRPTDLVEGLPKSIQGDLTLWYENGQKNMEAHYKDGHKDGLLTSWHSNGQKELEQYYINGKENGYAVYWNEYGKKTLEIYFIEGNFETVSYWEEGKKVAEKHYKKGKREGISTYWDKSGNKHAIETYQNDKLHGPHVTYYPNQNKQSEFMYKNNTPTEITLWHKNNQKAAYLKRNNENINCSIWDEKGSVIYTGNNNERCTSTIRNMIE